MVLIWQGPGSGFEEHCRDSRVSGGVHGTQFELITPCCSVFALLKDVPGTCGSVVHGVNKASPTPQQNPQHKPSNPKKPLSPKSIH